MATCSWNSWGYLGNQLSKLPCSNRARACWQLISSSILRACLFFHQLEMNVVTYMALIEIFDLNSVLTHVDLVELSEVFDVDYIINLHWGKTTSSTSWTQATQALQYELSFFAVAAWVQHLCT